MEVAWYMISTFLLKNHMFLGYELLYYKVLILNLPEFKMC